MLMFCPTCANILGVEEGPKCLRFSCSTCPYVHNITKKLGNKIYPKLKEVKTNCNIVNALIASVILKHPFVLD